MPWSNGDLTLAVTAAIAFAALVRPNIGRLYSRYRATIEMHPVDRIEVGFSEYGPTIGLQGTLRAISYDQFISSAKVTVERFSDHLRHELEWAVFRPLALSFTQQPQAVEIAAGFFLRELEPRRFNIQFHDRATADRFRPALFELQRLWTEHLQSHDIVLANVAARDMRALYDAFHKTRIADVTPLYQVERQFYWIEGQYKVTLELQATRPDRKFRFSLTFILSESESRSLRLNAIGCLLTACNVPNVYYFAYPQHQSV